MFPTLILSFNCRYKEVKDAATKPFNDAIDAYNGLAQQYNAALDGCSNINWKFW
jgi:hypothetical protein